jgi:O-methyltransferase
MTDQGLVARGRSLLSRALLRGARLAMPGAPSAGPVLAPPTGIRPVEGIWAANRTLGFLDEPGFAAAWARSERDNAAGWPGGSPDVRWRAHIALWAARNGLQREGDFVECGVHTGLLSLVICHALDFASLPRRFYLFDTFNGIPTEGVEAAEMERVQRDNATIYTEVFDIARRNFAPFPNAVLVRGTLPGSLDEVPIGRIAYLSMDLNNRKAEQEVIERLWDRIVPGAVILLDDYAWITCESQRDMWDAFAASHGLSVATLPTGQGLLLRP